jgi:hypothetical protein
MLQKKFVVNLETYFYIQEFLPKPDWNENMQKCVVQPEKPQVAI